MARRAVTGEEALHSAIGAMLDRCLDPACTEWHHSPNEGRRTRATKFTLTRLGTRWGWPDIEILARGRAHFMEVKTDAGVLRARQREAGLRLRAAGCPVEVVRSVARAYELLVDWGIPLKMTYDQYMGWAPVPVAAARVLLAKPPPVQSRGTFPRRYRKRQGTA